MEYIYHCQHQAEFFAKAIIPVPADYPLSDELPENFRVHFAKLCELAKDIYMDMAKQPESYGLKLISVDSKDPDLIREANKTIHKFFHVLSGLTQCGELINHRLIVSAVTFREILKKGQGAVLNPVPKYELILSRLIDFGFIISDFNGKPFGKNIESFTIEYPDYPDIIDTVKTYCDCWEALRHDHSSIPVWQEFGRQVYRFDYKITAKCNEIPIKQWIIDKFLSYNSPAEITGFYVAFYEYSQRYKGVEFNGDYNYKSKRIARDLLNSRGQSLLSLILRNIDKYIAKIESMPDSAKEPFTKSSCHHCGFQGATDEYCKYRRSWTLGGIRYEADAHHGFHFKDLDLARVPDYWELLELDYGLTKI